VKQEGNGVNIQLLQPGMIICYKLAPSQQPSDPDKLWKGRIMHRFDGGYYVECLESGYEGRENVFYSQVVGVEL
jgi:hypothetical protein